MMMIIIIILLRCGATSGLEGTCLAQKLVENEQLGKARPLFLQGFPSFPNLNPDLAFVLSFRPPIFQKGTTGLLFFKEFESKTW